MAHMVKLLVTAALFAAPCLQAFASRASVELENCFAAVGQDSGVNPALLRAIARVESSLNPNALNASHRHRTGSYDIGLMQINSRWIPRLREFGITEKSLHDACTSVEVGAWILVDLFRRYGPNWEAVGAYNAACKELSPVKCRAARDSYIAKVRKAMDETTHPLGARKEPMPPHAQAPSYAATMIQSIDFQE